MPKICMSELIYEFIKDTGFKINVKNHIWKIISFAIASKQIIKHISVLYHEGKNVQETTQFYLIKGRQK